MVVNFEVGKKYRYNGKIGDPSPFVGISIEEQDALFIVSGEPLVCTYVENHSCPFVEFEGMSTAGGWVLNGCYHLFDEVKEKTVVKETQKEERGEAMKAKDFLEKVAYKTMWKEDWMEEKEMEFDKSKILTAVTADQAKVGQKGWFGDDLCTLMRMVGKCKPMTVSRIEPEFHGLRFMTDQDIPFALFYPTPESSYRPFNNDELNDLVGKVVTNKYTGYNKLVTQRVANIAVRVGDSDCTAKDLFHYFTLGGNPCGMKEEV